ncbi:MULTISPECIES: transcription initiation factor IIB family protein [unclassified Haladaptatus]|uniref:transcription initiation factor IIB n=1 Tax=unclassified Haladaptatus TaxID=2622732 RepID=UPI00209BC71F|nr:MULTISPECIES: transcription initiation factor IIB family protein [unclassified Haladaptatus]MCO8242520.1 transcription initiation factor IIB family protein [Haladaptatus sp. AB643]MCO8252277.1 transcription initiation factor IIB family protein [Haladaptatus sp. AB618]
MSTTQHLTEACPECHSRVRTRGSETVCTECGLVVAEDNLDRGPEWRSFDDDDTDRKRTGAPLTRSRHDRGLTTEIGYKNSSVRLTGRKRRRVMRMRRQHNRARISSKAERNRVYGFTEIRRLVGALQLSANIRDRACVLFESAQGEDLLRGRSIEGFASAAVYATCRTSAVSRTLDEIVERARADRSELTAAYDALNRELGLPIGPIDPREYLPRFASRLDLSMESERRAETLVTKAERKDLISGRNPSGVAAACLYAAARNCDERVTQRAAAEVADVTPVTLRSTYHDLRE